MKMKWYISIYMMVIIGIVALSGCAAETTEKEWPRAVSVASGPTGGSLYGMGVAIAEMTKKYAGVTAACEATMASGENVNLIESGQAEIGGAPNDGWYDAFYGRGLFKDRGRLTSARTLFYSGDAMVQFVTLANSGIKTFADIKGKRVICIWPASTFVTSVTEAVLQVYGITDKDFKPLTFSSYKECNSALIEGKADVGVYVGGGSPKHGTVTELDITKTARVVSTTPDKLEQVRKLKPYIRGFTIKAGSYKGQTEDSLTFSLPGSWAMRKDLPNSLAYAVTKAIMEHPTEVAAFHPACGDLILGRFFTEPVIPYHPGAIKYYQEKNVWTGEMEKWQQDLLKNLK